MASNNPTAAPSAALSQEIKDIKTRCLEMCNMIANNTPIELQSYTPKNLDEKSLCYMDGVRAGIEAAETPVTTDRDLITSQFLTVLDENISQIQELVAYEKGLLRDIDAEILRLKQLIKMATEAKNLNQPTDAAVEPEHYRRAKSDFAGVKKTLQDIIQSLFPNVAEQMMLLLANLMQQKLVVESGGYMEFDRSTFPLVELLKDMGLVTTNPYCKNEIKLAY